MPEHHSPEALHTWLESLIAQVDHCTKEADALLQALPSSHLEVAWFFLEEAHNALCHMPKPPFRSAEDT